jgi:acyl phosphate:glycerol-3-phosphate acyltransferase
MAVFALVVAGAYLLGTVPTAIHVGRRAGFDPSAAGSGNPGASNAFRLGGRRAGAVTLAGDVVKGALAVGVGALVDGRDLALAAGCAAVVGHVFPVTRRFRGGKGVATAAGVCAPLFPVPTAVAALAWAVAWALWRIASIASFSGVVLLPIISVVAGYPAREVATLLALAALVIVRHRGNLARLRHGGELTT